MGIDQDIKQKKFKSEFQKAVINIFYTSGWLYNKHSQNLKPYGISNEQFNVLRILRGQYPNAASVKLLIDRMLDKNSNASRIVEKLRLKGLVERKECSADRRQVDVVISDKGLKLLEELDKLDDNFSIISDTFTEKDAKTLSDLLDKLRG